MSRPRMELPHGRLPPTKRAERRACGLGALLCFVGALATSAACSDGGSPAAPSTSDAGLDGDASPEPSDPPTWYRDVAPILARHCTGCHSGGGVGPFSLNSYDDARPRHLALAGITAARVMPPWLPGDTCHPMHAPRRMSKAEIATMKAWSLADGPLGDPATAAPAPAPVLPKLEWVDRTLDVGADFIPVPPKGSLNVERCFLLDPGLADDAFLVGYELVPKDRTQLFRAVLLETPLAEAQAKDDADPGPGWACPGGFGIAAGRVLGSWAETISTVTFPERSGLRLRKGYGIALQLSYHLHTSGVADRPKLSLQLAREPVEREVEILTIGPPLVSVPPRTTGYTLSTSAVLPNGGTIWAVQPHMHQLGRHLRAEARDSSGSTCLLDVPDYDYHWEEMDFFEGQGVTMPPGGSVDVRCVWDNPTDYPFLYGSQFSNEMCEVALLVTHP